MTSEIQTSPDRRAAVYRYHERIYRLALLVAGDASAADLLQRAYRQLPAGAPDAETLLIHTLASARPSARRWQRAVDSAALDRAALDRRQADALLGALARLTPGARLVIGLHYISGCTPAEIAALLGADTGDQPYDDLLARFRLDAAGAVGLVPADADAETLQRLDRWIGGQMAEDEALAVRRDLFEQTELRALRDGLTAARDLLPRAIAALFAAAPPLALTERLLKIAGSGQRPSQPSTNTRRAQFLLAAGVLALAAAIILLPTMLARRGPAAAARALSPNELIDAAIHRFERPPLQAGVLHELYRVERDDQLAILIERWYDYSAPNRLAISVKEEGRGNVLLQIGSDGRSLIQFRNQRASYGRRFELDARISQREAQTVLPLLRGQPVYGTFGRDPDGPADSGPLYLAQARVSHATSLGQTTAQGRPAFLLTYNASQPPEPLASESQSAPADGQLAQVLLTIDAQTYALLDVTVLAGGAGEGQARHPFQAQQFEVLASAPDDRFKLPSSEDTVQQDGLTSVRFPFIRDDQFLSLDDAAQRAPNTLLAPQQLPDAQMRGLAVATDYDTGSSSPIVLLYEGEFQNVVLLPSNMASSGELQGAGEERSAGDFRYRIVRGPDFESSISAVVYRPDAPRERLMLILNDWFATDQEREATLQRIIASLTPVDEQTLPILRRNFQAPREAAGKSAN